MILDRQPEFAGALEASVSVLVHRFREYRSDFGGDFHAEFRRTGRILVDDVLYHAHVALAVERLATGETLVENRTEREEVASLVHAFAERLFGRHVERCPQYGVRRGLLGLRLRELGEPKSVILTLPVRVSMMFPA